MTAKEALSAISKAKDVFAMTKSGSYIVIPKTVAKRWVISSLDTFRPDAFVSIDPDGTVWIGAGDNYTKLTK